MCLGKPNAADVPVGGYKGSCGGCKMEDDGRVLTCPNCLTAEGRHREAKIVMATCPAGTGSTIDNRNGELICVAA